MEREHQESIARAGARDNAADLGRERRALPLETEIRLGVLRKDIAPMLAYGHARRQMIRQEYLDPQRWPDIVQILHEAGIDVSVREDIDRFSLADGTPQNIRVRRIVEGANETFFLTIKGPKAADLSRVEIECAVESGVYAQLLSAGSIGSLEKVRYLKKGTLVLSDDAAIDIKAEIDDVTKVGGAEIRPLPVVFVEVEFCAREDAGTGEQIKKFLDGSHSLSWLPTYVDVSRKKEFGMKQIATHGVDHEKVGKIVARLSKKSSMA